MIKSVPLWSKSPRSIYNKISNMVIWIGFRYKLKVPFEFYLMSSWLKSNCSSSLVYRNCGFNFRVVWGIFCRCLPKLHTNIVQIPLAGGCVWGGRVPGGVLPEAAGGGADRLHEWRARPPPCGQPEPHTEAALPPPIQPALRRLQREAALFIYSFISTLHECCYLLIFIYMLDV